MIIEKHLVRYLLICITTCSLVVLFRIGFANSKDVFEKDHILQKLQSSLEGIQDFSATIKQEKCIAGFNSTLVSSGLLKWKKPHKLFVRIDPPDESQIFLSRELLWLYYPSEKIAEKYVLSGNQNLLDVFSFFALARLLREKNENLTISDGDDYIILEIKPAAPILKQVILWFSKKDLLLAKLELIEADGDKTVISYTDIIINSNLPDDSFQFISPKGVSISISKKQYPLWP